MNVCQNEKSILGPVEGDSGLILGIFCLICDFNSREIRIYQNPS